MIGALRIFLRPWQKQISEEAISYGLYAMGENYSEEGEWKKALKCLNRALVLQRSSLGEDNEITERTLWLIATCLMNIGEKLSVLVAFEEAMYIRMNNYEEGEHEAARITTDVWSLLHNNRISQEGKPDRLYPIKEMKIHENKNGLKDFICKSPQSLRNTEKGFVDDDLDEVDLSDSTKINKWRRGAAA